MYRWVCNIIKYIIMDIINRYTITVIKQKKGKGTKLYTMNIGTKTI